MSSKRGLVRYQKRGRLSHRKEYNIDPEINVFLAKCKKEKDVMLYCVGNLTKGDNGWELFWEGLPGYVCETDALKFANDYFATTGDVLSFARLIVPYKKILRLQKRGLLCFRYTHVKAPILPEGIPYPGMRLDLTCEMGPNLYTPVSLLTFTAHDAEGNETELEVSLPDEHGIYPTGTIAVDLGSVKTDL